MFRPSGVFLSSDIGHLVLMINYKQGKNINVVQKVVQVIPHLLAENLYYRHGHRQERRFQAQADRSGEWKA